MSRNPITIEALETLDAIERRGSFAKAAEELNKATSAVSYAIQKLEEQLEIALFQRQGRRSVLTPAGRLILLEGREIVETTTRLANQAKELATGWESQIVIGVEFSQSYPLLFKTLNQFLQTHPSIELDVSECVLNGGWEALEQGRIDLLVGAPGPVPLQKGYRAQVINTPDLVAVIAATHPQADQLSPQDENKALLATIRRVIVHDTAVKAIRRSEGLSSDGQKFYVQNCDQKLTAIMAGIGVGHLPRHRVQAQIAAGQLKEIAVSDTTDYEHVIAWKLSNKGKGLQHLCQQLAQAMA